MLQGPDLPAPETLETTFRARLHACRPDPLALDQIEKDAQRTHPVFRHFSRGSPSRGYEQLVSVLVCAAELNGVGYVQGINSIAAALLFHCDEAHAFHALARLFAAVEAERLYTANLEGVLEQVRAFFDEVLRETSPEAFAYLADRDIPPEMLFTEWFVTLGTSVVPLRHQLPLLRGVLRDGRAFLSRALAAAVASLLAAFRGLETAEAIVLLRGLRGVRWRGVLAAAR